MEKQKNILKFEECEMIEELDDPNSFVTGVAVGIAIGALIVLT